MGYDIDALSAYLHVLLLFYTPFTMLILSPFTKACAFSNAVLMSRRRASNVAQAMWGVM